MPKPRALKLGRESSSSEEVVKPLVQASVTERWRHVLNILYLNGSILCISEEVGVPVLVSFDGDGENIEQIEDSIELLKARFGTEVMPLVNKAVRTLLPELLKAVGEAGQGSANGKVNEALVQAAIIGKVGEYLQVYSSQLSQLLIQGAFRFADVLVAVTFESLVRLRRGHVHASLDEYSYEDMIEGLRRLGLIEPRLNVSLCSECANYEALLTKSRSAAETCGKCGSEWSTATVYTFSPAYELVKLRNNDLPLFISAYLRFKVNSQAPIGNLDLRPLAEVVSPAGQRLEIDVYLPSYQLGVECKTFENPFSPITRARLGSIAGELCEQVERYYSAGIKTVAIVTNLPLEATEKIKSEVTKRLRKKVNLDLVPGTVELLLAWIDLVAGSIAARMNKEFEKSMKEKAKPVKKPLEPRETKAHPLPRTAEPVPIPVES